MQRTKIEWTQFTWNPVTGCLQGCDYCYARRLSERFGRSFEPQIHVDRLNQKFKPGSKVFVCSMGELFGSWVPRAWTQTVLDFIMGWPETTFQVLTKQPQNLANFEFPYNLWVGVSVDVPQRINGSEWLKLTNASVKFISAEPLLGDLIKLNLKGIDWLIIGAQTNPEVQPDEVWVKRLLNKADTLKIPVFMKDNLRYEGDRRREFPTPRRG